MLLLLHRWQSFPVLHIKKKIDTSYWILICCAAIPNFIKNSNIFSNINNVIAYIFIEEASLFLGIQSLYLSYTHKMPLINICFSILIIISAIISFISLIYTANLKEETKKLPSNNEDDDLK